MCINLDARDKTRAAIAAPGRMRGTWGYFFFSEA